MRLQKGLKEEKTILRISFTAGLVCAIAEFIFAIITNSQSVLMDSLYDGSELIFIVFILFLTPLFHKPISEKYPNGFYQVESIIIIIKGFMMLSVTVGVSAQVIKSFFTGGNPVDTGAIALFQLVMAISNAAVFFLMNRYNKHLSSPSVKAEILGWKIDIYYSGGLAFAFFVSAFLERTKLGFLAPYFDQIIVLIIVALTLPESIKMLISAIGDVFLFPPDEETTECVKSVCEEELPKYSLTPEFYDITKTGRHLWAAVYFETPSDTLSVTKLGQITKRLNEILDKKLGSCTLELIASSTSPVPSLAEEGEETKPLEEV